MYAFNKLGLTPVGQGGREDTGLLRRDTGDMRVKSYRKKAKQAANAKETNTHKPTQKQGFQGVVH